MKVLELRGYKSLRALNAFYTLMLGLKMLPAYQAVKYEDFFNFIAELDPEGQEKLIREAVRLVEIQKDELEAIACFCTDQNGVPYTAANLNNLGPAELIEMVVSVCKEIAKIKVNLVSEAEKKS